MYIDCDLRYTIIEKSSNEAFQALWIEIHLTNKANIICGVIYRQHNSPEHFQKYFEETIEKLSATGTVIYIMSDTNINLLHASSCTYAQNFLLSLQSFSLIPTIDKLTRVHNNSATVIDNIFTSNVQEEIISGSIISDISDHFTQFCITRSVIEKGQTDHLIRDYSHFSEENYLNDLLQVDWARVVPEVETDVDKLFSRFYNKLNKLINKHAPLKPISKLKSKMFSQPWITRGLRKSIRIKNKLLSLGNKDQYMYYRNKILTLTRLSKKLYYQNVFQLNIKDMKKTWEGINYLINNKKKSRKAINMLKSSDNRKLSHNPYEHTNILNSHFASIGKKLASNIPPGNKHFSDYLPTIAYSDSFLFEPVLSSEVELEIMLAPSGKAHGLYSCPIRMLKCSRDIIAKPLTTLFHVSVQNGRFPSK